MDERGRAAAVQVDRALRAELDHQLGELVHREPAVDGRASPVAGDGDERVPRDTERGARVPSVRDVRVELPGAGREALAIVSGVEGDRAVRDEQRPGLQQVAPR